LPEFFCVIHEKKITIGGDAHVGKVEEILHRG